MMSRVKSGMKSPPPCRYRIRASVPCYKCLKFSNRTLVQISRESQVWLPTEVSDAD